MKRKNITALFLTCVLIFGLSGCGGSRLRWPNTTLGNLLPAPPVKNGEIIIDSDSSLYARGDNATQEQYNKFIEKCEQNGFTIDEEKSDHTFSAYNEAGYYIEVRYTASLNTIDVSVKASKEANFAEFSWPKSEIASSIPIPASTFGSISWEDESGFVIYVGETSKEDYALYVDACYEAGFTIDYQKGDDYFRANNVNGYYLNVDYEGNQTMFIRMDTAESLGLELPEQTSTPDPTPAPSPSEPQTNEPDIESEPIDTELPDAKPVSYSTNDLETAKNGNSGVFSYVNRGSNYYTYWIIDFDEGYVYSFTEGNGNEMCDRTVIDSGDLNSVLIITYHDGDDEWSYGLHFRYKNQPSVLIVEDNDYFETEYATADLADALKIRDSKTIKDY